MFAELCERIIAPLLSSFDGWINGGAGGRWLAADAGTLTAMRRSFVREMFQSQDALLWLLAVAALMFLLLLIVVLRHLFTRKQPFIPAGWITSPKQIRHLFNTALTQRSTFEMQFSENRSERRPSLRCSLEDLASETITLEAFGVKAVAKAWEGRDVSCYFKITVKNQPIYYTFTTFISQVDVRPLGLCLFRLQLPDKLQNRQKRAFLRIKPPEEYLLGAALWHGRRLPEEDKLDDVRLWTKPNLMLLPGKQSDFEITDLSAGGMRLTIHRQSHTEGKMSFNVAEQVIVLLDVQDPDNEQRLRFWLMCRVQNLALEYNQRTLEMGMQFQAWATPKAGDGSNIEWLRLTRDNEVAPLGNWIVRRHLELYRSMPDISEDNY
ncbi:MAG: hypothetical protein LBV80_11280 [Deltaproteobacteria bacterium]|jgi:hypothetical protein|nr:hypothetical protein [Deltaproteobacteria bacterium]